MQENASRDDQEEDGFATFRGYNNSIEENAVESRTKQKSQRKGEE